MSLAAPAIYRAEYRQAQVSRIKTNHFMYWTQANSKSPYLALRNTENYSARLQKPAFEIDSETEQRLWNEILDRNANCVLAMHGLGNAAYKSKDMSEAMRYYKLAGDREGYSKAYSFVRRGWIENNVPVIAFVLLVLFNMFLSNFLKCF